MATTVDFPSSPVTNQVFSFGTRRWLWDGTGWERVYPVAGGGFLAFTLLNGPFVTNFELAFPFAGAPKLTLLTHI